MSEIPVHQVDTLLLRLADVPARIAHAAARLSDVEKHSASTTEEWSAAEVLAHIRAADDIVAYRLCAILVRDDPNLPAYDERRWAEIAGYALADFESSLKTFALRRGELVEMLRRVAWADWMRSGVHEVEGAISLFDMTTSLVEHEEEHCLQLEALHH
jgi:hypothetical protein